MPKTVVTLGTFDGVHRGHQALLRKVVARAKIRHATPAALVFDMPPRHAGQPLSKPVLLTTLDEKKAALKALGIKRIDVLRFDKKTSSLTPEQFFRGTIRSRLRACEMVVGPKVAFGKNRAGKLPELKALGDKYGVRIHVVSGIGKGAHEVSSRRIRALLDYGNVEQAQRLLGNYYSVQGLVIHGDRRGRSLGFPTANVDIPKGKILPLGVYAVHAEVARRSLKLARPVHPNALCNVGWRPTFKSDKQIHCEVFLMRRTRSLYGMTLRVHFMRKLRPEKRFSSPATLQKQIHRDIVKAGLIRLYKKAHFSI